MMRRRLKELMQRYAEVAGEPLLPRRLALTTGLTTSTVHQLVEGNPKRVSFEAGDVRLNFFSEKLGPLPTDGLLQFVCEAGRPHSPKRFKRLPVTPSAATYVGQCCTQ